MDPKQQRQRQLLYGLLGVLAVVVVWRFLPTSQGAPPAAPAANPSNPGGRAGRHQADVLKAPETDVRLANLEGERATPGDMERNPFQFYVPRPAAPPVSQSAVAAPPASPVDTQSGPSGPPPPAPIALKFIGFAAKESTGKIAAFADSRGVYYGREGDVIEGQYRVVQIGEESVQIEHVDGRGRQTIRLTGS